MLFIEVQIVDTLAPAADSNNKRKQGQEKRIFYKVLSLIFLPKGSRFEMIHEILIGLGQLS